MVLNECELTVPPPANQPTEHRASSAACDSVAVGVMAMVEVTPMLVLVRVVLSNDDAGSPAYSIPQTAVPDAVILPEAKLIVTVPGSEDATLWKMYCPWPKTFEASRVQPAGVEMVVSLTTDNQMSFPVTGVVLQVKTKEVPAPPVVPNETV